MVLVFGTNNGLVKLGDAGNRHCQICREDTHHTFLLAYEWFHFYSVFGYVSRRRFLCTCDRCGNGSAAEGADLPVNAGAATAIPFMHRRGMLVGAVIAGVLVMSLVLFFFFTI
jgi:hypothetical protein